MSLKQRISDDMKAAMRAREKQRLAAIRLLLAAIKQKEVDSQSELDDAQTTAVIEKMCKQRRDSISQYQAAERQDLVEAEQYELEILLAYMPAQLGEDEIATEVSSAISETGAASPKDMGKVMGLLKGKLAGKADMGKVSAQIKAQLAQ